MNNFQITLLVFFTIIFSILVYRAFYKKNLYFTSYYFFEKEYNLIEKNNLNTIIQENLEKLGFLKIKNNIISFKAITKPSIFSFSELVKINIENSNNSVFKIKFYSKCLFPLQIFDWNKNRQNSELFFKKLDLSLNEKCMK